MRRNSYKLLSLGILFSSLAVPARAWTPSVTPSPTPSPSPSPSCTPLRTWYPRLSSQTTQITIPAYDWVSFTVDSSGDCTDKCGGCVPFAESEVIYDGFMLRSRDDFGSGVNIGRFDHDTSRTFHFAALRSGRSTVQVRGMLPGVTPVSVDIIVASPVGTTPSPIPQTPGPGVVRELDSFLGNGRFSREIRGGLPGAAAGFHVAGIGDVDGDGYDDWMMTRFNVLDWELPLEAAIIWGRGDAPPAWPVTLQDLPSDQGVVLPSTARFYVSPYSVSSFNILGCGDLDADGYQDFAIARYNQQTTIFFGGPRQDWIGATPNLDTPPAGRSLALQTSFPNNIAAVAGDVNGDGAADLVMSNTDYYSSKVVLLLGGAWMRQRGSVNLAAPEPGRCLLVESGYRLFAAAAQPGDVDGDGFDDILLTAGTDSVFGTVDGAANRRIYGVLLRGGTQWPVDGRLTRTSVSADRWATLYGPDYSPDHKLSGAGDLNGDGRGELVAYSKNSRPPGWGARWLPGEAIVLWGRQAPIGNVNVAAATAPNAWRIVGPEGGGFANSAAPAGDVNGDGLRDLLIGRAGALGERYQSYWLVYGSQTPYGSAAGIWSIEGATADQATLIEGLAGNPPYASARCIGDVNGDGAADIAIGDAVSPDDGRAVAIVSEEGRVPGAGHSGWARPGAAAPGSFLGGYEVLAGTGAAVGFDDGHGPEGDAAPSLQRVVPIPAPTAAPDPRAVPVAAWDITSTRQDWTTGTLALRLRPQDLVPVESDSLRLYGKAEGQDSWTTMTLALSPAGLRATAPIDRLGSFLVAGDPRPFVSPTPMPTITPTPRVPGEIHASPSVTSVYTPCGVVPDVYWIGPSTVQVEVGDVFELRYGYSVPPGTSGCWMDTNINSVHDGTLLDAGIETGYSFRFRAKAPGRAFVRLAPSGRDISGRDITVVITGPTPTATPTPTGVSDSFVVQ